MVSESEQLPTLVLNPPDDEDFRSTAERLIGNGCDEPTLLQHDLRRRWPGAIVRRRDLSGEQAQIWYVYRDGHWIRPGR